MMEFLSHKELLLALRHESQCGAAEGDEASGGILEALTAAETSVMESWPGEVNSQVMATEEYAAAVVAQLTKVRQYQWPGVADALRISYGIDKED